MNKVMTPLQGGKYIRRKDGSLERVDGTDNDPKPVPAEPTENVSDADSIRSAFGIAGDGAATSTKKGK